MNTETINDSKWVIRHANHTYEVIKVGKNIFHIYAGERLLIGQSSLTNCQTWVLRQHACCEDESEAGEVPTDLIPRITVRDHHDSHILYSLLANAAKNASDTLSSKLMMLDLVEVIVPKAQLDKVSDELDRDSHIAWDLATLADEVARLHDLMPEATDKLFNEEDALNRTDPYGLHDTAEEQAACKYC